MAVKESARAVRLRGDLVRDLTRRAQAEYREMPGLSLTLAQAQRLWGIDRQTSEQVLHTLIARGFLRKTTNDRFVRA
jgi:Fic family protein